MNSSRSKRARPAPAMGASPTDVAGLRPTDWIVLPGRKPPPPTWPGCARRTGPIHRRTRRQGRHRAGRVRRPADAGRGALIDPEGIDGNGPGLGLLPLVTVFEPAKTVQRTSAAFGQLTGAWAPLSGVAACGYPNPPRPDGPAPAMAAKGDVAPRGHARHCLAEPGGQCAGRVPARFVRDAAVLQGPVWRPGTHARYRCSTAWPMGGPTTSTRACWTLIA